MPSSENVASGNASAENATPNNADPGNAASGNVSAENAAFGNASPGNTAVLLLNVGTPRSPSPWHVATYLTEFLTDKRVISLPWLFRQLLVRGFVVPFRAFQSAAKYRRIWTPEGSPLLVHSTKLQQGLQQRLPHMRVLLAMRYGEPSIAQAVDALMQAPPARLWAVPMFPHYSSATTGTGLEQLARCMARHAFMPSLHVVEPLSGLPAFHQSLGQKLHRHAQSFGPEHVLFSYHGLPLAHVYAACRPGCQRSCQRPASTAADAPSTSCYVHACHATSQALAAHVHGLPFSTAFQSRMRGSAWTGPATLDVAKALAKQGTGRLMVACPSFTCDCLETLEEVGMGIGEAFLRAGGKAFEWVPCLNDEASWLDGLAHSLRSAEGCCLRIEKK
jgi:ferrochelatase